MDHPQHFDSCACSEAERSQHRQGQAGTGPSGRKEQRAPTLRLPAPCGRFKYWAPCAGCAGRKPGRALPSVHAGGQVGPAVLPSSLLCCCFSCHPEQREGTGTPASSLMGWQPPKVSAAVPAPAGGVGSAGSWARLIPGCLEGERLPGQSPPGLLERGFLIPAGR